MSEFIAFICGMILMLVTWFISDNDDRRQYRIGYRDGYADGVAGRREAEDDKD